MSSAVSFNLRDLQLEIAFNTLNCFAVFFNQTAQLPYRGAIGQNFLVVGYNQVPLISLVLYL